MFAPGPPYVLLSSIPGSGVTWLRYLLEGCTGVYAGSVAKVN